MTFERTNNYTTNRTESFLDAIMSLRTYKDLCTLEDFLEIVGVFVERHNESIIEDYKLIYGRGGRHVWVSFESNGERILIIKD